VNYIFGTIHLQDSAVFNQRDTVLSLLRTSQYFFAEIDLDSISVMANPQVMMLPEGKALRDFYTEDEYTEIQAALEEKLGPFMTMAAERLKPVAVAGLLMLDDTEPTAHTTVDQFLWQEATRAGCIRGGLERIAEQLTVLDSMPPSILLEVIRDGGTSDSVFYELRDAYVREDLELISDLVDSVSSMESFMERLNDDRNVTMAERMVGILNRGNAFIAIGTAHLPGRQGVLKLLRDQGFTVSPVVGGSRHQWLKE